jgi:hypothetical protein
MALTWNNNTMTSDRTPHSARSVDGSSKYWGVSYLPGIWVEYDDACMAITITENPHPGDRNLPVSDWNPQDIGHWVDQELWADILGLDIEDVRRRVSHSPLWAAGERRQRPRQKA